MTDVAKIKQEQEALNLIEQKIKITQKWLIDHYDNPYASKVRRDLNALQVDRQTRERVIQNLSTNIPSHGYEIMDVPESQTKNNK